MSRPPGIMYAPGSPYRPMPYPQRPVPGCVDGAHSWPIGTTDREGAIAWVCPRCFAVRDAGDPTWRTP